MAILNNIESKNINQNLYSIQLYNLENFDLGYFRKIFIKSIAKYTDFAIDNSLRICVLLDNDKRILFYNLIDGSEIKDNLFQSFNILEMCVH